MITALVKTMSGKQKAIANEANPKPNAETKKQGANNKIKHNTKPSKTHQSKTSITNKT